MAILLVDPRKTALRNEIAEEKRAKKLARRCRRCRCTDDNCIGCIKRTGERCHWVDWDLCSACVKPAEYVRYLVRLRQPVTVDCKGRIQTVWWRLRTYAAGTRFRVVRVRGGALHLAPLRFEGTLAIRSLPYRCVRIDGKLIDGLPKD